MAKTWVLHTETKGTGAQMVPIESVTKHASTVEPVFVPRRSEPAPKASDAQPQAPHKFKIVDVMTRQTLAENANAQATVDLLRGVRSVVDVNVYLWQEQPPRWRMLSLAQQRALMDLAERSPAN